jgi:hypothetical protein
LKKAKTLLTSGSVIISVMIEKDEALLTHGSVVIPVMIEKGENEKQKPSR